MNTQIAEETKINGHLWCVTLCTWTVVYISFNLHDRQAHWGSNVLSGFSKPWEPGGGEAAEQGPAFLTQRDLQGSELLLAKPSSQCSFPPFCLVEASAFSKHRLDFHLPSTLPWLQSTGLVPCLPQNPELLQCLVVTVLITCHPFYRICDRL